MPSTPSEPTASAPFAAPRAGCGSAGTSGRAWVTTWVAAIVVLLAIAGVTAWGISTTVTPPAPLPPAGWLTFYQAAPVAQQVVDSLIIGPWALTFATGVAADGPWAPTIGGTFSATPPCAARLSGISLLTYWNESYYPVSHAANIFSSGATPLWTFGYRDQGGDTAVVSVVNGTGVYNGEWTAGSGCAAPIEPQYQIGFAPASVVDSSRVALTVMNLPSGTIAPRNGTGTAFDPSNPGSAFEMYSLGDGISGTEGIDPQLIPTDHLPTWWDVWGRCGLAGDSGWSPSDVLSMNVTTGLLSENALNSPTYCQQVGAVGTIRSPTIGIPPGPAGNFEGWSLGLSLSTSIVPAPAGWNRITTDTISPSMFTNATTGAAFTGVVPSAAALCGLGTGTLASCTVNPSGWYVVLADAHGDWLDSYPSAAGGSNWTRPGVPVVSGDEVVLFLPQESPSVKLLELTCLGWDAQLGAAYLDL